MAFERMPTDEVTGQPLLIRYSEDDFTTGRRVKHAYHHPHFNRGRDVYRDDIGVGLRMSLVTLLPNKYHLVDEPNGIHNATKQGPDIVNTPTAKATQIVYNLSRIFPRMAIDLSEYSETGTYTPVELNNREYNFLTDPSKARIEGNTPETRRLNRDFIGHAVITYALMQDVRDMATPRIAHKIRRFENAKTEDQAARFARNIIDFAVAGAVDDLLPSQTYKELKREGMVARRALDPHEAVGEMIPGNLMSYHDALREALSRGFCLLNVDVEALPEAA